MLFIRSSSAYRPLSLSIPLLLLLLLLAVLLARCPTRRYLLSPSWSSLLSDPPPLLAAAEDDDDDDDDDDDGGTGNNEKWQQRSKRKRRRKRSSSSGKYHHLPGSDEKFVEIEHKWLSFKNMLVGGEECFAKGEQGECNRQEKIALSSFSSSGTASIVSTSPPPVSLSSNKNEKRMGIRKKELELDDIPFPTPPPYETGAPKPDTFGYFGDLKNTLLKMMGKNGSKNGGRNKRSEAKRILRTLYLRYHPDKIRGRLQPFVRTESKLKEIVDVSKAVTQALTSVKQSLEL